jgi:hypothetical protein
MHPRKNLVPLVLYPMLLPISQVVSTQNKIQPTRYLSLVELRHINLYLLTGKAGGYIRQTKVH